MEYTVWVRADLKKLWMETGEIDVGIDNCGQEVVITVNAADVIAKSRTNPEEKLGHYSNCSVFNDGSLPRKQCDCGVMPYRHIGKLEIRA